MSLPAGGCAPTILMRWFTAVSRLRLSRLPELGEHSARRLDRQAWRLVNRFEPVSRAIHNVTTTEAPNLALNLAAQAFLTLVPLVIVMAAFAPRLLGVQLSAQLQAALGLANSSLAFQGIVPSPGRVARVGGAVGLLLTLSAAFSVAAALQRAYEKSWQLPRLGVVRSSWRFAGWLIACALSFVLSGIADAVLGSGPASTAVLILLGLAGSVLFWWWTPHLLLGGRVGWRALLPGSVLTGGVLGALIWLSPLIMPAFVASTEWEFGPIGTVFVVMLWLMIVGSVVILGAIVGEVIARDRRVMAWARPPAPQLQPAAGSPARGKPDGASPSGPGPPAASGPDGAESRGSSPGLAGTAKADQTGIQGSR